MTLDTSALAAIGDKARSKPSVPAWRLPELSDFKQGKVIAFDPSLAATGAVALICDQRGLTVYAARSWKTESLHGGHEGNLDRFMRLWPQIRGWLYSINASPAEWKIVHEAPPVGGGKILHPESSLLGGAAVRIAAEQYGLLVGKMISPQPHKHFICGDRKADKRTHHAVLKQLIDTLPIAGAKAISNEATRDALSVAMHHLARG